jgi:hypothetical protein
MASRWVCLLACSLALIGTFTSFESMAQSPASAAPAVAKLALPAVARPVASNNILPEAPPPIQFAMTTGALWNSRDAIVGIDASEMGLRSLEPAATDKSECRWSLEGTNFWACRIKPLTKYSVPIRDTLHRIWPLHGRN